MHVTRRPARPVSLILSTSIFATQAYAVEPCFTDNVPSAASNAASAAAAVSVAAADSSTNQILQVLQQRREQQQQSCPTGYILVGSACEPAQTASTESAPEPEAEPVASQSSAASQSAATSSGAGSGAASQSSPGASGSPAKKSSAPKPKPQPAAASAQPAPASETVAAYSEPPVVQPSKWGSWAEGYLDYEKLQGLTLGGVDDITQKQTTSGYNSGTDLTFATGRGGTLLIGAMGGALRVKQEFSTLRQSGVLPTDFAIEIDPADGNAQFLPPDTRADITLDLPRSIETDIEQVQTGQSLGLYGSHIKNGWFIDGLFRADLMEIERVTVLNDTRIGSIENLRFGPDLDPRGNGNTCFFDNTQVPDAVEFRNNLDGTNALLGPAITERTVIREKADFENYTFGARIGTRIDIDTAQGTWWEPSANLTYLFSNFGSDGVRLGFDDGHLLTLQGGARWGITQFNDNGGYFWTVAAGAYAFSDVLIDGFAADGFGPAAFETEEGEIRALGTLQLSATWLNGMTWYSEGQIRGGEDLFGVGGKIGGRIQW